MDPSGLEDCAADFCVTATGYADPFLGSISGVGSDIFHPINEAFWDLKASAKADQRWNKAEEKLSNGNNLLQGLVPSAPCAGDFAALQAAYGVSLADVQTQANISTWVDGTRSTDLQRDLFTQGTDAYNFWDTMHPGFTVSDFFLTSVNSNVGAETALAISGSSGKIYFRPQFVNGLSNQKAAALLTHELLHSLGIEDAMAQRALGIAVSPSTSNISDKFYQDCFK